MMVLARTVGSAALASVAILLLFAKQQTLSLGDLLLIAIVASLFVTIITPMFVSFLRKPDQFMRALEERARYAIAVPVGALLLLYVLIFRIMFILFKLSIKMAKIVLGIIYVIIPFDLIPDFIIGLGQLDDVIIFISVVIWALSPGIKKSIRASIDVNRPTTPFP
jgi:amino acid transporter